MRGFDLLAFAMFWLLGLSALLFPQSLIDYSRSKRRRPPGTESTTPEQVRRVAGIYLAILAAVTLAGWWSAK
jgi:hypothetical protein